MLARSPINQALLFIIVSSLIGLVSNALRTDSIDFFAKELPPVQSVAENGPNGGSSQINAINLTQAKTLFDRGTLFIDARDTEYIEEGHIPGALVKTNFMELVFTIDSLQGKDQLFVTYCSDDDCGDSEILALELQSMGFTNIYVFKGGWIQWTEAGYPVEK